MASYDWLDAAIGTDTSGSMRCGSSTSLLPSFYLVSYMLLIESNKFRLPTTASSLGDIAMAESQPMVLFPCRRL